ncbi:MAG TPA: amino acid permease [Saprospiraceae bacterium]|nr:amino acid permease [Saprospiraceae bacterium]
MAETSTAKKLGIWSATALVMGNMIGGGIFLLPSALAGFGSISLLGWVISAVGSIFLALIFSRLSRMLPQKNGGPYAYTQVAFGDFMGFLIAWGYWVSIWTANAAITVTFVGSLSVFFPVLAENRLLAVATGLIAIWLLTWVNSKGIRNAAIVQVITTVLKIAPLLLIIIGALFFFEWSNFRPFHKGEYSIWTTLGLTASMTLYAFLGFESATIPAKSIDRPRTTIPLATTLGTLLTALIYIASTAAVMGLVPMAELENSAAPIADAAMRIGGEDMRYWVAGGIAIATFGALNGWILILGQIPLAIAEDHLFPKVFAKLNRYGAPHLGLIIGSILVSILMLFNYSEGLVEQFKFMTLLTTLSVLTPYLFSTAAHLLFVLSGKTDDNTMIVAVILSILAFVYSMWMVYGAGAEVVYWGFLLLLAGIPFYVWIKWRNARSNQFETKADK